jgi:hypothetical protein
MCNAVKAKGIEGIVAKRKNSVYRPATNRRGTKDDDVDDWGMTLNGYLNRNGESLLDIAGLKGAKPERVPFRGVLSPLAEREIV